MEETLMEQDRYIPKLFYLIWLYILEGTNLSFCQLSNYPHHSSSKTTLFYNIMLCVRVVLWFVFLIFISYIYITLKILIHYVFLRSFISSHSIFTQQPMCSKLNSSLFMVQWYMKSWMNIYMLRGKLWKDWSACDLSFDVLEEESAWG